MNLNWIILCNIGKWSFNVMILKIKCNNVLNWLYVCLRTNKLLVWGILITLILDVYFRRYLVILCYVLKLFGAKGAYKILNYDFTDIICCWSKKDEKHSWIRKNEKCWIYPKLRHNHQNMSFDWTQIPINCNANGGLSRHSVVKAYK